ncbi:MAG: hypothetical protein NT165_01200 [Candidatus Falkowbacteria bacterium]|nr:hypothetical protein [Candidatus Falkowbacteria bacterium]
MVTTELLDFIRKSLATGQQEEQIRATLTGAGWVTNDIDEGFKRVGSVVPNQNAPITIVNKSKKKILIISAIIAIFLLAGGAFAAYYYFLALPSKLLTDQTPGDQSKKANTLICEVNSTYDTPTTTCSCPEKYTYKEVAKMGNGSIKYGCRPDSYEDVIAPTTQTTGSIIAPNGGERILAGSTYEIKWDPNLLPNMESVIISISADFMQCPTGEMGCSATSRIANAQNTGSYLWDTSKNLSSNTVPSAGGIAPWSSYKIYVSANASNIGSKETFSIILPELASLSESIKTCLKTTLTKGVGGGLTEEEANKLFSGATFNNYCGDIYDNHSALMGKEKPTREQYIATCVQYLPAAIIRMIATCKNQAQNLASSTVDSISTRDSQRQAYIKQIQSALEIYFNEKGSYPPSATIIDGMSLSSNGFLTKPLSGVYLEKVPVNPIPMNDGGCPNKNFIYNNTGNNSYALTYCLGSVGKPYVATPSGMK